MNKLAKGKTNASWSFLWGLAPFASTHVPWPSCCPRAKLHGLQLPNDLSVIGYDNLQICQFTSPKLTSISQNVRIKALLATKILLEKICSGIIPEQSNIMLDVELVERESVISIYE